MVSASIPFPGPEKQTTDLPKSSQIDLTWTSLFCLKLENLAVASLCNPVIRFHPSPAAFFAFDKANSNAPLLVALIAVTK